MWSFYHFRRVSTCKIYFKDDFRWTQYDYYNHKALETDNLTKQIQTKCFKALVSRFFSGELFGKHDIVQKITDNMFYRQEPGCSMLRYLTKG